MPLAMVRVCGEKAKPEIVTADVLEAAAEVAGLLAGAGELDDDE